MAEPDFTEITIRHVDTGVERQITKNALPYFPDWERVDSQGRRVAPSTSVTTPKES